MSARMRQILATRYYAKLLALPQKYFDNQVTGTIIARLDRSINGVTQFMQSFSNNFFPMLITAVAVLAISAVYYWPLAVLLAALFPIYMWLTALTSGRWQQFEGRKTTRSIVRTDDLRRWWARSRWSRASSRKPASSMILPTGTGEPWN
jgi:ABC-type multidrug transport system, ATPase and permease components